MFFAMVTRVNVPLFLMVSGSCLLGKIDSISVILRKRVLRIVAALSLAEILFYVVQHSPINFWELFSGMLAGNIAVEYWYLYAYLGMLLTLPYLRRIVMGFKEKDFLFFLSVHFMMSTFLPMINCILKYHRNIGLSFSGDFKVPLMTINVFFYSILGYYLDQIVDIKSLRKRKLGLIFALACAGIFLSCLCTYIEGISEGFTQNYVMLFDYVTTIAVFIFVKYAFVCGKFEEKHPCVCEIISKIGMLTFGIYLLDPIIRAVLWKYTPMLHLPMLIVSLIWCVFSMVLGGIITCVLKRLPVLKRIL